MENVFVAAAAYDPDEKLTRGEYINELAGLWQDTIDTLKCSKKRSLSEDMYLNDLESAVHILMRTYPLTELFDMEYYRDEINKVGKNHSGIK